MKPGILFALAALSFAGSAALAQPAAHASAPPAPACRELDASAPEWQAIGSQYARLARAMRARDFDAMVALYAPAFEVRESQGQGGGGAATREQSIALQRNRMAAVRETQLISNTILKLVSCGDRATATVLQQWYRTVRVGDRDRLAETAAVQDEEWLRTPGGWLRGNIANVHPGAWLLDGKRLEPGQPYREDAPPFEPFAAAPAVTVGPDVAPHECRPAVENSPLWATIGHNYHLMGEALRRRDEAALLSFYAPSIETRLPNGAVWNRDRAMAYARAGIAQVRETRLTSNVIVSLQDCGNRAVATVLQQWYRTQMFQGQVSRLETAAVQDEEWRATADGWKWAGASNVHSGAWMIDGRRLHLSGPDDQRSPGYEPYADPE